MSIFYINDIQSLLIILSTYPISSFYQPILREDLLHINQLNNNDILS